MLPYCATLVPIVTALKHKDVWPCPCRRTCSHVLMFFVWEKLVHELFFQELVNHEVLDEVNL